VVSNFVVQALRGQPLTVYGSGMQTRSFCFVSDLVEGLMRLMHVETNPGPLNLGNPEELNVLELAHMIVAMCHSSSSVEHLPLPGDDPARRRPDITRARRILHWDPRVSIRAGLRHTIRDFRARAAASSSRRPLPYDEPLSSADAKTAV
jgi:UDP-glucuronate decarboxylase